LKRRKHKEEDEHSISIEKKAEAVRLEPGEGGGVREKEA
jgi:hypothetical protein